MSSLNALVDATLVVEKLRVQSQVRLSHLKLNNVKCEDTKELYRRVNDLEKWIDKRIAGHLESHSAYPWFSRVKGIGKENIAKVVALVDIEKASTISALWKFSGYAPGDKRVKGEKLCYNSQLRMLCWRVAGSLLKAKGKYYTKYLDFKDFYVKRCEAQRIKIVPAASLPKVNGKKIETATIISEGHIHNMALRKMIKLFLANLWLVWREAEGLPTRNPYSQDYLGHSHIIDPWEMVDR